MLDFEVIKTDNLTKLVIADLSDWTGLTGSEADILLPECEAPETVTLTKNVNNTYTLGDLAVTKERLPDGVYDITIRDTAGTTTKQKKHLRTTNLRLLRDRYFLRVVEGCEDIRKEVPKINTIDLYIEAAYANLRDGDSSKAVYFYNQAKSKLDELLNC